MFADILSRLPIEKLTAPKEEVNAEVRRRITTQISFGGKAKFLNSDTGQYTFLVIRRLNTKSASGVEFDPATGRVLEHKKWRVSISLLMPA